MAHNLNIGMFLNSNCILDVTMMSHGCTCVDSTRKYIFGGIAPVTLTVRSLTLMVPTANFLTTCNEGDFLP